MRDFPVNIDAHLPNVAGARSSPMFERRPSVWTEGDRQTVVRVTGCGTLDADGHAPAHSVQSPLGQWQTDRSAGTRTGTADATWGSKPPLWTPCGCSPHPNCPAWSSHAQRVRRGAGFAGPAVALPRYVLDDGWGGSSLGNLGRRIWPRGWRSGTIADLARVRWNLTTTGPTTVDGDANAWRSQQSWRPPTALGRRGGRRGVPGHRHGQPTDRSVLK